MKSIVAMAGRAKAAARAAGCRSLHALGNGRDGMTSAVVADRARPTPDRIEPRPAFSRAIGRQAERTGNGCAQLFSAGADAPLHRETK